MADLACIGAGRRAVLAAIALGLGACVGGGDNETAARRVQELPELPVSIEIAETATIRFDKAAEDFVLVYVTFSAEQFGIYAGNSPNTPLDPAVSTDISPRIGARYPVYCAISAGEGGESGHCLVDLSDSLEFPQFLHFFYEDFEPESVAEVMAVIASARVLDSEGI